jgi:DNA-binding transcriptional LysR family regulator
LSAIRDAVEGVNRHRVQPSGTLRLNTSAGAARRVLGPLIFEYMKLHSQMAVDIVTEGKLIDIVKDGFDAGFRLAEHVPGDMIAVPLGLDQRLILVAAPSYLAGRAHPRTPADLAEHDCIRMRLSGGAIYRWELEKDGVATLFDAPGRLTLDDSTLIREAALAGFGIAYISEWDVAADLASGRLVQLMDEWTPPFPGLCLYYPGRRHVPAGLRALIDLIQTKSARKR